MFETLESQGRGKSSDLNIRMRRPFSYILSFDWGTQPKSSSNENVLYFAPRRAVTNPGSKKNRADNLRAGRDRNPYGWSKEARERYHDERRYHRKSTGIQMAPAYVTEDLSQTCPPKEWIMHLYKFLWEHHQRWKT